MKQTKNILENGCINGKAYESFLQLIKDAGFDTDHLSIEEIDFIKRIDALEKTNKALEEENEQLKNEIARLNDQLDKLKTWEKYDYKKEVKSDVLAYLTDEIATERLEVLLTEDNDDAINDLYDDLFCDDSVTGNGSGSYFYDSLKAERALIGNYDLYKEACQEFGGEPNNAESAESRDVAIRCYLLYEAILAAIEELRAQQINK